MTRLFRHAYIWGILLLFLCSCKHEEPQITAESYEYDFGDVNKGQICECSLVLSNETNKKVKIDDIITECGCTTASVKSKVIRARNNTELDISFDSNHKTDGFYEYSVLLFLKNKQHPYCFKIKAYIHSLE